MKRNQGFSIIIDKLTNSIEEVSTKLSYETQLLPLTKTDLKLLTRKNGWHFSWRKESAMNDGRIIMKLVTTADDSHIQGVISYKKDQGFYFIPLIESAPFIILGKTSCSTEYPVIWSPMYASKALKMGVMGLFLLHPKQC